MVFDDNLPIIDESRFITADWSEFCKDATEPIPPNVPELRGNPVDIHAFVDADHAGGKVTRRSQTGIIIFLNRALIIWFPKKQNEMKPQSLALNLLIESLCYKLRMMGVPITGPAGILFTLQT
jgi:hypothetical protein